MPISEDEYDPRPKYEAASTMSKAELRKTHKPIMEKRRRARINHCLNEIKTLILDALKKDPARHSKLEKADILEMAVKHLQNVQRQQLAVAMATDPSVLRKFKAGFNECAEEVTRYVGGLEGLEPCVQQRISSHLSKCISGIEQIVHLNFPGFGGVPFLANAGLFSSSSSSSEGDQNNNPSIQIPQSLKVIPSRLPTGELALLLPGSSNLPYFPSTSPGQGGASQDGKNRPSAFVTVVPSSAGLQRGKSPSKPPSPPQSPSKERSTPSPHGFRPVNPRQPVYSQVEPVKPLYQLDSSSEAGPSKSELKTIRFPIQKYPSPQKLAEPLSIITNQSERYKQAQMLEETAHFEENQRGVKRKGDFSGLLTVAPSKVLKVSAESAIGDFRMRREVEVHEWASGQKAEHPSSSTDFLVNHTEAHDWTKKRDQARASCTEVQDWSTRQRDQEVPSTSREQNEANSDMWRPW